MAARVGEGVEALALHLFGHDLDVGPGRWSGIGLRPVGFLRSCAFTSCAFAFARSSIPARHARTAVSRARPSRAAARRPRAAPLRPQEALAAAPERLEVVRVVGLPLGLRLVAISIGRSRASAAAWAFSAARLGPSPRAHRSTGEASTSRTAPAPNPLRPLLSTRNLALLGESDRSHAGLRRAGRGRTTDPVSANGYLAADSALGARLVEPELEEEAGEPR